MITELTRNSVTALANDNLTEADYREIFDELRDQWSLAQLVERLSSHYSKAWWSKYERGKSKLTTLARNELRHAVGLELLPPAMNDVLNTVDPNGAAFQIGVKGPDRVLLWNQGESPQTLENAHRGPCNQVTRRGKTICDFWSPIWGLDSVPKRILAQAIRERIEI